MYACLNVHEPFLMALGYCKSDILRVTYPQVCMEVANSALCHIWLILLESAEEKGFYTSVLVLQMGGLELRGCCKRALMPLESWSCLLDLQNWQFPKKRWKSGDIVTGKIVWERDMVKEHCAAWKNYVKLCLGFVNNEAQPELFSF